MKKFEDQIVNTLKTGKAQFKDFADFVVEPAMVTPDISTIRFFAISRTSCGKFVDFKFIIEFEICLIMRLF